MDFSALQRVLEDLVTPFLETHGADLVELSISGNHRRKVVRIFVDRLGGVTIDECAAFSRGLEDVLDTHDPIEGAYTLEVSSPGLNRALKTTRDYRWAQGKSVRIVAEGRGTLVGELVSVGESRVVLKIEGEAVDVVRTDIKKANLYFDF